MTPTRPAASAELAPVARPLRAPRVPADVVPLPPARNPFERVGRAQKVARLVNAIDRQAVDQGIDPLRQAHGVCDQLRRLTVEGWCELADLAGCHAPSLTTQQAVIAEYARRANLRPDLPPLRTWFVVVESTGPYSGIEHGIHATREAADAERDQRQESARSGSGFLPTFYVIERQLRWAP